MCVRVSNGKLVWQKWVSYVLQGQRSGKDPADQLVAFLPSQVSHHEKHECISVDIFIFLVERGFFGPLSGCQGQAVGRGSCRSGGCCRSLCSPAQRASSHLTAVLLMSCRARETVSRTSWSFWYTAITFTDLPSTQSKWNFLWPVNTGVRRKWRFRVYFFFWLLFWFSSFASSHIALQTFQEANLQEHSS